MLAGSTSMTQLPASCILLISATAPSRASAKAGSTFCLHFTAASITWEVPAAWDMHGICMGYADRPLRDALEEQQRSQPGTLTDP